MPDELTQHCDMPTRYCCVRLTLFASLARSAVHVLSLFLSTGAPLASLHCCFEPRCKTPSFDVHPKKPQSHLVGSGEASV